MKFELLLFSTDPEFIQPAVSAGIDGIIVDWERLGKNARQQGADTQINQDTLEDLQRVRACTTANLVCRINGFGSHTAKEVVQALENGADEILLPMVEQAQHVETVLELCHRAGRGKVGILVETLAALRILPDLAALPLCRVYVGLNDLAIQRGTPNIFSAIQDGTLAAIRPHFMTSFGFGGLTLPDRGSPIPCRLLIGEMARLDCSFSFLRRSFLKDIRGREPAVEVPRIRQALEAARQRTPAQVTQDVSDLHHMILGWTTITVKG